MPTYEYRCKDCGHEMEATQSFHDDPLTECPSCQGLLKKKFSAVGISFKGGGFYKNDSRSGGAKSSSIAPAAPSSESSSSSSETSSSGTSSGDGGTSTGAAATSTKPAPASTPPTTGSGSSTSTSVSA